MDDIRDGCEKGRTYQVTGLGTSSCKNKDGPGAGTSSTIFELSFGRAELASLDVAADVDLWNRNGGGSGQSGEKGDCEELHDKTLWVVFVGECGGSDGCWERKV